MDHTLRKIVIGVGPSAEVDPHLRAAVALAESRGAELHVVHAYRLPDPLLYPYPEMSAFSPETLAAAHAAAEERVRAQVATLGSTVETRIHAVVGPADRAIVETAEDVGADLIIVGATERGVVSRALLGTTAARVLRAARAPVLVHRAGDERPFRHVLLTTDLSDLSRQVLRRAIEVLHCLGADAGAEVRTLLVLGDGLDGPMAPAPAERGAIDTIADRELRPMLEELPRGGLTIDGKAVVGDPTREIVLEADRWPADLIVVGTHGRGGVSRFLIGSVAESVVRHAECDVLVIPASSLHETTETSRTSK